MKRFFDKLGKQGREQNKRYIGWDKLNPNLAFCEKKVFVKRLRNKLIPSKYVKLYDIENNVVKYICITNISYYLGYREELEVSYLDYGNSGEGIQRKKIGWNDLLRFEGEWLDGKEHNKVLDIFKLNLPEKTYRFLAYDWEKYPKRVRKGTDPREKIKTFVDVVAITEEDAWNKSRKLSVGKLMITEEFEIL